MKEFYTRKEVCDALEIGLRTIRYWNTRGKLIRIDGVSERKFLKVHQDGKNILYKLEDIEEFLDGELKEVYSEGIKRLKEMEDEPEKEIKKVEETTKKKKVIHITITIEYED